MLTLSNGTLVKDFSSYGIDIYTEGTVDISNTTVQKLIRWKINTKKFTIQHFVCSRKLQQYFLRM